MQSLSYHHRGVWRELLDLMWGSEQRGKLILNGKALSDASLARLLGLSQGETADAIKVLLESGVASRCEETSALVNRRMVRDEEISQARSAAGRKGGNSTQEQFCLSKSSSKPQANHQAKPKQNPDIDNDNDNGKEKKKRMEEIKTRLSGIFRRRPETKWSEKEQGAFVKASPIHPADLAAVECYYAESIPQDRDYRRRDLLTLLNHWPGEVDRAGARKRSGQKAPPRPKRDLPDTLRAWLLESFPRLREEIAIWKYWEDVPGHLRNEWAHERANHA